MEIHGINRLILENQLIDPLYTTIQFTLHEYTIHHSLHSGVGKLDEALQRIIKTPIYRSLSMRYQELDLLRF